MCLVCLWWPSSEKWTAHCRICLLHTRDEMIRDMYRYILVIDVLSICWYVVVRDTLIRLGFLLPNSRDNSTFWYIFSGKYLEYFLCTIVRKWAWWRETGIWGGESFPPFAIKPLCLGGQALESGPQCPGRTGSWRRAIGWEVLDCELYIAMMKLGGRVFKKKACARILKKKLLDWPGGRMKMTPIGWKANLDL